jgi:hypothetical protein
VTAMIRQRPGRRDGLGLRRVIVAVIVVIAALLSHQRAAAACSCSELGTFAAALSEADAVFVGTVMSTRAERRKTTRMARGDQGYREHEATVGFWIIELSVIDVLTPFGELRAGQTVQVATAGADDPCGYAVEVGQTHLIVAYVDVQYRAMMRGAPLLSVDRCSHSHLLPEGMAGLWTLARASAWVDVSLAVWRAAASCVRSARAPIWPREGREP